MNRNRMALEKYLKCLIIGLPVWEDWSERPRGFAEMSLASIVGEAGNLSNYKNPAKLWKRFGLAVINGQRQRKVKGIDALEQGYNPKRRSVAWNVGECLIKSGGEDSYYRALYLERKEYEAAREKKPIIVHRRAARYMTKRFLRNLWVAWWDADINLKPEECVHSTAHA
jgi:hypothetical protein